MHETVDPFVFNVPNRLGTENTPGEALFRLFYGVPKNNAEKISRVTEEWHGLENGDEPKMVFLEYSAYCQPNSRQFG